MTTCKIRPLFHGPISGLKLEAPLYIKHDLEMLYGKAMFLLSVNCAEFNYIINCAYSCNEYLSVTCCIYMYIQLQHTVHCSS